MSELLKVQEKLKVTKSRHNNFGNYNYRSCEDILEAVKPILVELGLTLTLSDEIIGSEGENYVKATALLRKEEVIEAEVSAFAREQKERPKFDASQLTGSASSYARKYCLNGLFLLDDTKDADTNEYVKASGKTLTKEELATRFQTCKHIKELENAYTKYKPDVDALPPAQTKAIKSLVGEIKKSFQDGVS